MKTSAAFSLTALTAALLAGSLPVKAAVNNINSATSSGYVQFDDTASLDPFLTPGVMNTTVNSPVIWNGAQFGLAPTTAPITFDTAQGDLMATFAPLSYAVNLLGVALTQPVGNTGFALMRFQYSVDFVMDAGGLPSAATLAPVFFISGTVQGSSFTSFTGRIQYTSTLLNQAVEGVTYNYFNSTPGTFSTSVFGVPIFGTLPTLPANDTLTLYGDFMFKVDPSSINAFSTTVPEPSASLLSLLSLPLFLGRRRAART